MDPISKYYLDVHYLQLQPNTEPIPDFPYFLEVILLQLIFAGIILMSISVSILRCKQQKPTWLVKHTRSLFKNIEQLSESSKELDNL